MLVIAIPERVMMPYTVARCALSAHVRPLFTAFSNVLTSASFALCAAALNLAIFCWAVSLAGAGSENWRTVERAEGLEAYGPFGVNRVASSTVRAIVAKERDNDAKR